MQQLDEADQQFLLRLARRSIEDALRGRSLTKSEPPSPSLFEPRGAFVTLKIQGRLRGCIGHVDTTKPLYRTIPECAVSAALHDPRFEPVRSEELPSVRIGISVLSPLVPISPSQVEVGRHGLMISSGSFRGLLLPEVAVEWKWDRERFLEETCLKANLPRDAWRHGVKTEAFTAQTFAEPFGEANPASREQESAAPSK